METHVLNKKEVIDFHLTKIGYKNPYDFSVYHRHDYFELFLFEEGKGGEQNIDFVSYKIEPKSVYFVTPGQVHLLNRKTGETGHLIQFTKSFLGNCLYPDKINVEVIFRNLPELLLNQEQFLELNSKIIELRTISENSSSFQIQKIKKQFALIIYSLLEWIKPLQLAQNKSSLINQFLDVLKTNIHKNRSVSYYATTMNISVNSLGKITKEHLGYSPLKIIHRQLIIEIKRRLIFDEKSHKELANHFNFDDFSSFSRFVKKQTGYSPTLLKKELMKIAKS